MRREYTTRIIVRCTAEERGRWKALAERLEKERAARAGRYSYGWSYRREEITLSALVRQLLQERLKAAPGAPAGRPRRRNVSAAAGSS